MIPMNLISEDFKYETILVNTKHGIIALTTVSDKSLHVATLRIFRLARRNPNAMIK